MLTVKYKGRVYPVASLEDASAKWKQFRQAEIFSGGGGCSKIGNGLTVRDQSGRIVGKVSYNGRIWPTKAQRADPRRPARSRLPRLPSAAWQVGDRFELRYEYQTEGLIVPAGALGKITLLQGPPNAVAFVVFDSKPTHAPAPVGLAALARIARPPRPNPGRRKAPAPRARARQVKVARRELNAAVELFHKFREAPPKRVRLARFRVPKVCLVIGEMDFVGYTTTHARKRVGYRHDFSRAARPLLCSSADGRQLLIFGGNYDFTRDGIVDRA